MTTIDLAAQADLPEEEARVITARIRDSIRTAWRLISRAYEGRVWLALGYDSWDAYLAGEFGAAPLRVPREERQEIVASLRDAGMTQRAIASAVGVDQKTISNDLAHEEFSSCATDERTKVTGLDGKQYSRSRRAAPPAPPLIPPASRRSLEDPEVGTAVPASVRPAEHTPMPSDEELDAQFERERAGTASRFRANWSAAVARAGDLRTFDLDRAVEVCDRYGLELQVTAWREWAADLERKLLATSGLRVVGGRDA